MLPDERQPHTSLSPAPVRVTSIGLIALLDISPDALLVVNQAGAIVMVNGQTEALFGYAREELLGQQLEVLLPKRFHTIHTAHRKHYFSAPRTRQMGAGLQLFGKRKNETEFPVDISLRPLLVDEVLYAIGAVRDVTEQKRMEEELAIRSRELERTNNELRHQRDELTTLNTALEEAYRARSQFFSTMSHELRTPLASIIGFSQLALEEAVKANWNQRQQNNLERILKNAQHLLSLINDVLDLTKMEAGRMDLTYSQVDVRELLTSVVEQTQSIALAQQLVVRAEVEEGIDCLQSHPLKLRQILLNLVSNALKFTEKGEVTISARRVLSSDQQADHIALAVKDTGMGIPSDIQERIFEAFYQVDGSYTRKSGGTGLGLSIVKQLTTLLGGTIEVTSAPGHGSTFTVTLPIKAVEPGTQRLHPAQQREVPTIPPSSDEFTPAMLNEVFAGSANPEATDGHHKVVLAVDDSPDVIVLIKAALEDTPYTVVGVQDPLQVMELVQQMHPCAITLDVMMPDVNGWQILHQLKADPATASIPVVMLTVLSEQTTGYVLGADDYLIKPFKSDVLLNTLQRLVTSKQSSSQTSKREAQQV